MEILLHSWSKNGLTIEMKEKERTPQAAKGNKNSGTTLSCSNKNEVTNTDKK